MRQAWIQTLDGKQYLPQRPNPELINEEVIATVLARTCRFGGHSKFFYSVAQHCVLGLQLIETPKLELPWLMHDAHEAYSGFGDVSSPVKGLTPIINKCESLADVAIAEHFDFDHKLFTKKEIKHTDQVMLSTEKEQLMGVDADHWGELPPPANIKIRPWDEARAIDEFLAALDSIREE